MRKVNLNNKGVMTKNSFRPKINKTRFTILNFKYERSAKMKINNLSYPQREFMSLLIIFFSLLSALTVLNGCSDPSPAGIQNTESNFSASGKKNSPVKFDSTHIKLDVNISFKSQNISDSKMLESNIGNRFNHIVSINHDVNPGEELNLQELQPGGIFSLYLSANGTFSLINSDGMAFSSKTVLMEKCSFIDLILRNEESQILHVNGFVAGE